MGSDRTPFHLRRLKVLDGAGIESAEQAVAKERYAGRLTVDALVEKVGHNFWEHVRELDLSRSKIRELTPTLTLTLTLALTLALALALALALTLTLTLTLTRSKIRELEGLQGAEFVNLRELNLDSNLLRSSPLYLPYTAAISPLYLDSNLLRCGCGCGCGCG